MAKKKRIGLFKRLAYIPGWLRNPGIVLMLSGALGLVAFSLVLSFPCGKGSSPIDGVCNDGTPLWSFSDGVLIGLLVTIIFALGIMLLDSSDGKFRVLQEICTRQYTGLP